MRISTTSAPKLLRLLSIFGGSFGSSEVSTGRTEFIG